MTQLELIKSEKSIEQKKESKEVKMDKKENTLKVRVIKPFYKGFSDGNNTVVYDCKSLHFIRRGKIAFSLLKNKVNYLNAIEMRTLYQLPQHVMQTLESQYQIRAGDRFRARKPINGKFTKIYFCGNSIVIRKGYYAFSILRNTNKKQFVNRLTQAELDLINALPEGLKSKIVGRANIELLTETIKNNQ